jgi:hypothetical protein
MASAPTALTIEEEDLSIRATQEKFSENRMRLSQNVCDDPDHKRL